MILAFQVWKFCLEMLGISNLRLNSKYLIYGIFDLQGEDGFSFAEISGISIKMPTNSGILILEVPREWGTLPQTLRRTFYSPIATRNTRNWDYFAAPLGNDFHSSVIDGKGTLACGGGVAVDI